MSWFPSASSLLGFEDLINFLTLKDTPTTEEKTRAPPVAAQLGDAISAYYSKGTLRVLTACHRYSSEGANVGVTR